jgi:hypothetical protein
MHFADGAEAFTQLKPPAPRLFIDASHFGRYW